MKTTRIKDIIAIINFPLNLKFKVNVIHLEEFHNIQIMLSLKDDTLSAISLDSIGNGN